MNAFTIVHPRPVLVRAFRLVIRTTNGPSISADDRGGGISGNAEAPVAGGDFCIGGVAGCRGHEGAPGVRLRGDLLVERVVAELLPPLPEESDDHGSRNGATSVTSTSLRSGKVEATKIHHLVPRSHEVTHERLLRVVTCVDFRDRPELGVRT